MIAVMAAVARGARESTDDVGEGRGSEGAGATDVVVGESTPSADFSMIV